MTNPTSNFGWQMPTPTDLVTSLPADFEVFGQAVDTSMADLKGGTTGQILSKATNTDMDFVWITNDQGDITGVTATSPLTGGGTSGAITVGIQASSTTQSGAVQLSDSTSSTSTSLAATANAVKAAYDLAGTANTTANAAIPKSTATAKGNVFTATGASTPAVLAVGSNNQVLTADSSTATGLKWATPVTPTSGLTLVTSSTFSGASTVSLPNSTFTSTYTNYKVIFIISSNTVTTSLIGRYRASGSDNTGTTYYSALSIARSDGSTATQSSVNAGTSFTMGFTATGTPGSLGLSLDFLSPQAAAKKQLVGNGFGYNAGQDAFAAYSFGGWMNSTSQFDSFSFIPASGGTITGSYFVYGYSN
jgi:hypothetical protein